MKPNENKERPLGCFSPRNENSTNPTFNFLLEYIKSKRDDFVPYRPVQPEFAVSVDRLVQKYVSFVPI